MGAYKVLIYAAAEETAGRLAALAAPLAEGSIVYLKAGSAFPEQEAEAVKAAAAAAGATVLIAPASRKGNEVMARASQLLDTGCVTEALSLAAADGKLTAKRAIYGGIAVGNFAFETETAVLTVALSALAGVETAGAYEAAASPAAAPPPAKELVKTEPLAKTVDLTKAKRIVSFGRGVAKKEDISAVEALAAKLGAEIGCSRPIAEELKWLPQEHQVGITGAIVNRQPFGGMKLSAFGPGLKAGGPNYCAQFMHIADKATSATDYKASYAEWYEKEFKHARNIQPKIRGEQNVFRYLPLAGGMVLRLFGDETLEQVEMVQLAAKTVGTPLTISMEASHPLSGKVSGKVKSENLAAFCESIKHYERIRTISADVPDIVFEAAANHDKFIAQALPLRNGRIELINYIKEQSIANEYHRYGSQIEVPEVE